MVSKMPNVTWPIGTFNDSVKEWQQQWFTTRENPSSSAGFVLTSSADRCATNKALQLLLSSSVGLDTNCYTHLVAAHFVGCSTGKY